MHYLVKTADRVVQYNNGDEEAERFYFNELATRVITMLLNFGIDTSIQANCINPTEYVTAKRQTALANWLECCNNNESG